MTFSSIVPIINLGLILIGSIVGLSAWLFSVSTLKAGIEGGMELLRQIQAQHQANSEKIAALAVEAEALGNRVSRLEGIVNHR